MTTILIVDDEQAAILAIKLLLKEEDYPIREIFEANDYENATQILKKNTVDLLFTDIEMPGQTGLQLLEWVTKHRPLTQVIVISGFPYFEYAQSSLRRGAIDYLLKPIQRELLYSAVEKAIKRKEQITAADQSDKINLQELLQTACFSKEPIEEDVCLKPHFESSALCLAAVDLHCLPAASKRLSKKEIDALFSEFTSENKEAFIISGHASTPRYFLLFHSSIEKSQFQFRRCKASINARLRGPVITSTLTAAFPASLQALQSNAQMLHRMLDDVVIISTDIAPPYEIHTIPHIFTEACLYHLFDSNEQVVEQILTTWQKEMERVSRATLQQLIAWLGVFWANCKRSTASISASNLPLYELQLPLLNDDSELSLSAFYREISFYVMTLCALPLKELIDLSDPLEKAKLFIQHNYKKPISLSQIAEYAHLNSSYLSRKFKDTFSIGVMEYIKTLRIEHSKHLLLRPQLTVNEIASLVGYKDAKYFCRVFKQVCGITPTDFRRTSLTR